MKSIYVGFSKPSTSFQPFAWLIRTVECRPYDHVYILLQEPTTQNWVVFQASKEMVNLYSQPLFLAANIPIKQYEISCNDEQYAALWQFIIDNLGIPYSLSEDFGILLMKIFKLQTQPFNHGMSAEFCSKLGANVCNLLGITTIQDTGAIDPSALDQILSEKNLQLQTFRT